MEIIAIRHTWGLATEPLEQLDSLAEAGYQGIESPVCATESSLPLAIHQRGWRWIAQLHTDLWNHSHHPQDHIDSFYQQCRWACDAGAHHLNVHAGIDMWDIDTAATVLSECAGIAQDFATSISFETHRSRILFHPRITYDLCQRLPWLRLSADYSHWCAVCERLLPDCGHLLQELASRIDHLHARVGHSQGPQVDNPWAPRHQETFAAHLRWWDAIVDQRRLDGAPIFTFTPEFGPEPYLPAAHDADTPDLAALCNRLTQELLGRWAAS